MDIAHIPFFLSLKKKEWRHKGSDFPNVDLELRFACDHFPIKDFLQSDSNLEEQRSASKRNFGSIGIWTLDNFLLGFES